MASAVVNKRAPLMMVKRELTRDFGAARSFVELRKWEKTLPPQAGAVVTTGNGSGPRGYFPGALPRASCAGPCSTGRETLPGLHSTSAS